jgi:hypothetical protein
VKRRAAGVALAAALLGAAGATPLHAQEVEEDASAPVAWHAFVATGGAFALGGPQPGVWAGGGVSRNDWGVRAELFVFDPGNDAARLGLALGSLSYELGRTKRHLVVTAHFGGGMRFPEVAPVGTAGLHTQLGLMKDGPLVLGADVAVHVDMGELPLDVYLLTTLSVGLTF